MIVDLGTPPHAIVPDVDKLAVLRANALGDYVFAVPALESLRAAYPAAEIVLLARDWHRDFLAGRPGPVDRVVAVPHGAIGDEANPTTTIEEREAFFAAMRAERFDLALQLHGGGGNSNPFVRALGARVTAGMRAPGAPPLDRTMPYIYFQHEVLRYLEAVTLVGAPPVTLAPRIAVLPSDLADSHAVVADDGRPLVALHPGASDPRRRWPPERFAAVADALAGAGARALVTGDASERALTDTMIAAMRSPAEGLSGQLSLGGLTGLLSRCRVVVSNDTGPLHLGAAVGAATVGLFWAGNMINGSAFARTRYRPLVSWRMHCHTCGVDTMERRCEHNGSFVDGVSVEEATEAALDLLGDARE